MALNRAEADLKKAKSELAKLELQVEITRARVLKLEHYIEMARIYEASEADQPIAETPKRRGGVVGAVIDILRESRSEGMQTREILEELKKRGIDIGGNNPITNLSSTLSRADDLVNVPGVGWTLKVRVRDDVPIPESAVSPAESAPEWAKKTQEFAPSPGYGYGSTATGPDLDDEIPF